MRISIIGPGSMGIVLSYFLKSQNEVSLVVKREDLAVYRRGLVIVEDGLRREFSVDVLDSLIPSELTIIAVKSYDLENVVKQYRPKGNVMFIQNGIGHIDLKQKGVKKIFAVTTWGAKRLSRGVVELTGKGYFRVGSDEAKINLGFLSKSGINAEWAEDITKEIYRKAAINAVINPLTSVFNVSNGELIRDKKLWNIASLLISELEILFKNMGYDLEIEKNVLNTCRVTRNNVSSMLQDLLQGRRTEIESITGELLKLGKKQRVKMVANEIFYKSVLFLQQKAIESQGLAYR